MKDKLPLISVLFPLILFAFWAGRYIVLSQTGTAIRLPVSGYDPRDLLAGHYLRYTVNYGEKATCNEKRVIKDKCICVDETDRNGISTASWLGDCSVLPQCKNWLKGVCLWSGFDAPINRYYFPENFTGELKLVPENSSIEVKLDGAGNGIVTGFFVNNVPLLESLKKN